MHQIENYYIDSDGSGEKQFELAYIDSEGVSSKQQTATEEYRQQLFLVK